MDLNSLLYAVKPVLMLLIQPPVPFLGLMLLGSQQLRAHPALSRGLLLLGFAGSWLSCSDALGQLLALHVVGTPPALSAQQIEALKAESDRHHALAVLVLGGGIRQDVPEYEGPRPNSTSQERLRFGVWLAKRLNAPLGYSGGIGWTATRQRNTESEVASAMTRDDYALPLKWAEGSSRDTRENAALSLPLLKQDGIKTVVLVTHDMHMPRAISAFNREAGEDISIIAAPVGLRRDAVSKWSDWCPSASGMARVHYAMYELIGRLTGH
ncbi:YdcF family protein [Paucibacter sp. AS339]|uniref:YdcF family protein n=1 Tax=Paucibacter hankyongi TaxID=3133434 RepID=UPI0030A96866